MERRSFLIVTASAAGALLVGVDACAGRRPRPTTGFAPGPFVRIDPDDTVTVVVARAEMGQGARTALAMMVAEELDADWSQVTVRQGDLDPKYGDQFAGGSAVVRTSWTPMRQAGATARWLLRQAASQLWGVPAEELETSAGKVRHRASGRSATYGELTEQAAALTPPAEVPLKPRSAYRIVGTSRKNLDHPAIVTGRIRFGMDQRVPGMLYAVVERAPVFGAQVIAVDDKAARAVPGVRDVVLIDADRMPFFDDNNPHPANGVGVLADSTWAAMQGRRALKVTWDDRGATSQSTDGMRVVAQRLITRKDRWSTTFAGDVDKAMAGAHRRLVAVYETPLLAHAQMEPMNCLARVGSGRCEVWAPTQMPEYVQVAAERITGLPASAITVHVTRMGGAFGRRFYADYAAEAIALAQSAGRPVQVVWSREDDTRHGFYRPAGYHMLRGGTDRRGRVVAWEHRLFNASRAAFLDAPSPTGEERDPGELSGWDYPAVLAPAFRIGYSPIASQIPRGQWRSVENSSNVFVIQGFLDELAHLARRDPFAFRLDLINRATQLTNPKSRYEAERLARVLRTAAARSGWGRPLPRGWGRGIAACYANQTYVAEVVEVQVQKSRVIPRRVVAAVDAGLVVDPNGAEAQVRGAIVMGLSAALHEEITVTGGKVDQGNFDTYPVMRLPEAPAVEVEFVGSSDVPGGLGEPALPPAAPALVNAVFAATGIRLRRLPIRAGDLTRA